MILDSINSTLLLARARTPRRTNGVQAFQFFRKTSRLETIDKIPMLLWSIGVGGDHLPEALEGVGLLPVQALLSPIQSKRQPSLWQR